MKKSIWVRVQKSKKNLLIKEKAQLSRKTFWYQDNFSPNLTDWDDSHVFCPFSNTVWEGFCNHVFIGLSAQPKRIDISKQWSYMFFLISQHQRHDWERAKHLFSILPAYPLTNPSSGDLGILNLWLQRANLWKRSKLCIFNQFFHTSFKERTGISAFYVIRYAFQG